MTKAGKFIRKGGGSSRNLLSPPFWLIRGKVSDGFSTVHVQCFKFIVFVYLIVRTITSITGYFGRTSYPAIPLASAPNYSKAVHSNVIENVFGLWERWDTLWFIQIARDGYLGNNDVAFMPLFPLLIRVIHTITFLPWILCGLLISNISVIVAFYFLYRITALDYGTVIAKRTVWYQALFPGSVFLFSAYSESLYLMLSVGSYYFSRKQKWVKASVLAAALCLTRNTGILILIPLLVEVWTHYREDSNFRITPILWLGLIPITFFSYLLFWNFKLGDPFAFIHAQDGWQRSRNMPWTTLWNGIQQAWQFGHSNPGGFYVLETVVLLSVLGLWVTGIRRIRSGYSIFVLLNILPALCAPFPGRVLMSFVRFAVVLFPSAIVLATLVKNENQDLAIKLLLASLLALVTVLFLTSGYMF